MDRPLLPIGGPRRWLMFGARGSRRIASSGRHASSSGEPDAAAAAVPSTRDSPGQTRRDEQDFIHEFSPLARCVFVGVARTSDVIASRRLASDWLGNDITRWCASELRWRKRATRTGGGYSTIRPPGPTARSGSTDSATFDSPHPPPPLSLSLCLSVSLSLSFLLRPLARRLGRSRSASFPPLSLLPAIFRLPCAPFLFAAYASPPSRGDSFRLGSLHSVSISRRLSFSFSLDLELVAPFLPFTRSLSLFLSLGISVSFAPLSPLHFHLTIILVLQILLALPSSPRHAL